MRIVYIGSCWPMLGCWYQHIYVRFDLVYVLLLAYGDVLICLLLRNHNTNLLCVFYISSTCKFLAFVAVGDVFSECFFLPQMTLSHEQANDFYTNNENRRAIANRMSWMRPKIILTTAKNWRPIRLLILLVLVSILFDCCCCRSICGVYAVTFSTNITRMNRSAGWSGNFMTSIGCIFR